MSFNPISAEITDGSVFQNENQAPKHARINALLQEATRGIAGLFLTKTAPLVNQAQVGQPQVIQAQVGQAPQKRKPTSASEYEVPKKTR